MVGMHLRPVGGDRYAVDVPERIGAPALLAGRIRDPELLWNRNRRFVIPI